jgi:radical SAM protein with 4Fe4S-binding SPASM domain
MKMNSRKAAVQDALADRQNTWNEIQQGLQALLEAGYPDADHILGIETIICAQNYDEIPTLWRWARDHNIIPYIETMTDQGRATLHPSLHVDPKDIKTLFEQLAAIDKEEYGHTWLPRPPLAGSHCARHEYSCTVTSIGEVFPCPGVSIATGNIREQPLKDILNNSSVIQELRNIRSTITGKCKECEHLEFCYGCRGNAYQTTGDHLASDPACWIKK